MGEPSLVEDGRALVEGGRWKSLPWWREGEGRAFLGGGCTGTLVNECLLKERTQMTERGHP